MIGTYEELKKVVPEKYLCGTIFDLMTEESYRIKLVIEYSKRGRLIPKDNLLKVRFLNFSVEEIKSWTTIASEISVRIKLFFIERPHLTLIRNTVSFGANNSMNGSEKKYSVDDWYFRQEVQDERIQYV